MDRSAAEKPKTANRKNASLDTLARTIRGGRRILITGHARPDGDALGSVIALARSLTLAGIDAAGAVASRGGLGGPAFLEGIRELRTPQELRTAPPFDLLVALDCGSSDRIPAPLAPLARSIPLSVNIDHHCTNTRFGDVNRVEPAASSTGEIVWKLIRRAGWPFDRAVAEALWVALITDTGRFAYETTRPSTLRCGADLLRRGVRTAYINDRLYCSFPPAALELKRRAFQTLAATPDGAVATISLDGKDFRETGGAKADAEDVIDIPRGLRGNLVALFFYGSPGDPSETRVSIRTRAPYDASDLAGRFGGGGHIRAAGCTIPKPLREAKRIFLETLREWMKPNGYTLRENLP